MKNLLTQWKTEEENRTKDQLMKNLPINEGDGEENQKIIDIVDEKTFQPGLRTGKEKPRLMEGKKTCLRMDLVDKELGQNKVLCISSGVKLPIVNYHAGSPALSALEKQIFGYLPASSSKTALTQILFCHPFFLTSLSAFLGQYS